MTSDGDPRKDESDDRPASDFGPPVGEFGPPVSEFGPPLAEFGPPMGDTGPRWPVPEQSADHPELVWRPADEWEPTPAQYRAPDASTPPAPDPRQRLPAPQPGPPERERPASAAADADKDSWWTRPTDTGSVPKPPPLTSPGLSWADDPIAQRLAPSTPAAPPPRKSGSHRGRNMLAGILAVVILIGLTVTVIVVSRNGGGDPVSADSTTAAGLTCPSGKDGKVTVGNGNGDTASGAGAILGFQYAFYVQRSGAQARAFVAPDAENVSSAEIIQGGINAEVPVGTKHCLRITEVASDTFDVDLTQRKPDGTETIYHQTITTVVRDGKVLVYSIKPREV
ncbi:hypothetical protein F5X71_05585 [Nocardia brasiliensis]|uniref:DUF8176 domain-containing protein n=1 Tax=Nocardia brasiliensis TaxID=37326 RepID=A0A6G9XLU8_NOCBR|nr:hypothetical protein [Nocardia brasiliensis]QIS01859.1 hypothetical protein F5X71_05585 [Nocardia brasiliensis]